MDKIAFKKELYSACQCIVNEKLKIAQEAVNAAKTGAQEQERSTAGDKYDTARAMSHIDQDMYGKQLTEVLKLKQHLDQIPFEISVNKVESGALVTTTNVKYFIATSIGLIKVKDQPVVVISPVSPVGQAMLGKRVGDAFQFNSKTEQIVEVV